MTDHRRGRRGGIASVGMLVALLVVAVVSAGLIRVVLARRSALRAEETRLQVDWLVESGLDRAGARLLRSADYAGETWRIAPEDLGGRGAATVVIRVDRVEGREDRRSVRVEAEYPSGSPRRVQQSREVVIRVQPSPR